MPLAAEKELSCFRISINGIVQGVGFRPFIYRLAHEMNLKGTVLNSGNGIEIEVENSEAILKKFIKRIKDESPQLAKITHISNTKSSCKGYLTFSISSSERQNKPTTLISPDSSVCPDCLKEMFDPGDRRYRYPFINCTNCGPRYTIIKNIPYDRPFTSMSVFEMCPQCSAEYSNPLDRRFHAQPNACPQCGPELVLAEKGNERIATDDPISETIKLLKQGSILAIRGIGGFHLAADPQNNQTIRILRERKGRAGKPFALMADSLDTIKKHCYVSPADEKLLTDVKRPIVLLKKKNHISIADDVAPKNKYLGFMLPYSPIHFLLFSEDINVLIMTSANYSDEPIAIKNDEALERLGNIADYFLFHDREIIQRCDDSICRIVMDNTFVIRRSRGFVPEPVFIDKSLPEVILGCGGELKNTIALGYENKVFLSQHIGDLDNPSAYNFFKESIDLFKKIFEKEPSCIAYDMHPEYLSSKWAKQQAMKTIPIQHHHAHLASVMTDNAISEPTIGLILDGTGYGADGTIWGGEILIGDFFGFERFAWLEPFALLGGEAGIKQPWRLAFSILYKVYGDDFINLSLPVLNEFSPKELKRYITVLQKGINTPLTSSCGRLFDAVSSLLNICNLVTYEAQAAIELEMTADPENKAIYPQVFEKINPEGPINTNMLIQELVNDHLNKKPVEVISSMFHNTLAEIFTKVIISARQKTGINRVGLSGGVFQNVLFFSKIYSLLQKSDFEVLIHKNVPCNDGGLALGQTVIAGALINK